MRREPSVLEQGVRALHALAYDGTDPSSDVHPDDGTDSSHKCAYECPDAADTGTDARSEYGSDASDSRAVDGTKRCSDQSKDAQRAQHGAVGQISECWPRGPHWNYYRNSLLVLLLLRVHALLRGHLHQAVQGRLWQQRERTSDGKCATTGDDDELTKPCA